MSRDWCITPGNRYRFNMTIQDELMCICVLLFILFCYSLCYYILYYYLFSYCYGFKSYPDLVVGTVCPVFALTIGVATVDLGADILATAAGPRGT